MKESDALRVLAKEAVHLSRVLPPSTVEQVVEALECAHSANLDATRARIMEGFSHPYYRACLAGFFDRWCTQFPNTSAESVAFALLTAKESHGNGSEFLELVWTGPDVGAIPVRHTEQAILQVIQCASRHLIIASFAVYRIPHICDALVQAAQKGVAIDVIVETPDQLETENAYSTLKALGPAVASHCSVFLWPLNNRSHDKNGRSGILHLKCAVADANWLLLTSANLTQYAFQLNMELGVLVTGGTLPAQVESQLVRMIQTKILTKI
jgi:phosphatidylserine/phosphatidylglycerophosphate/cardiolipin synthase-like enzyme